MALAQDTIHGKTSQPHSSHRSRLFPSLSNKYKSYLDFISGGAIETEPRGAAGRIQGFVTWAQNKTVLGIVLMCRAKAGKGKRSTTAAGAGKNCKKHSTIKTILN